MRLLDGTKLLYVDCLQKRGIYLRDHCWIWPSLSSSSTMISLEVFRRIQATVSACPALSALHTEPLAGLADAAVVARQPAGHCPRYTFSSPKSVNTLWQSSEEVTFSYTAARDDALEKRLVAPQR